MLGLFKISVTLFFIFVITIGHAEGINPYLIVGENSHLILKYPASMPRSVVTVDVFTNGILNNRKVKKFETSAHMQQMILETIGPDKSINISIVEENGAILYEQFLPSWQANKSFEQNFLLISDTQGTSIKSKKFRKDMAHLMSKYIYQMDYILHAGDFVDHGKRNDEWVHMLDDLGTIFQVVPVIATVGNHSFYKADHLILENLFVNYLRNTEIINTGQMSLDFGTTRILVLNSIFSKMTSEYLDLNLSWLEEELSNAQKEQQSIIIMMHYHPISSGFHNYFKEKKILNKYYIPLFEQYKENVKLIISGHAHIYERSFKDGINYLVLGPISGKNRPGLYPNPYQQKIKRFIKTFTILTIRAENIEITSRNINDEIIDHLIIPITYLKIKDT